MKRDAGPRNETRNEGARTPGFPLNQGRRFGTRLSAEEKPETNIKDDSDAHDKQFVYMTEPTHVVSVRLSSHMELTSWKGMPKLFRAARFPIKKPSPMYTVTGSTSLNVSFVSLSIK